MISKCDLRCVAQLLTQLENSADEDDAAGEKCEQDGVDGPEGRVLGGHEGHDGRGADRDVLGAPEDGVHEASYERRVQAVLKMKILELRLTH